jgi:hypothetical protein
MKDKTAFKHIHELLQNKDRWYIKVSAPDIEEMQDIAQKAAENADYELPRLSVSALYCRYLRWRKTDPIVGKDEEYFHAFLSQVVYDLGRDALKGNELLWYKESCGLTLKFN